MHEPEPLVVLASPQLWITNTKQTWGHMIISDYSICIKGF